MGLGLRPRAKGWVKKRQHVKFKGSQPAQDPTCPLGQRQALSLYLPMAWLPSPTGALRRKWACTPVGSSRALDTDGGAVLSSPQASPSPSS